jgi:hypothetical protein
MIPGILLLAFGWCVGAILGVTVLLLTQFSLLGVLIAMILGMTVSGLSWIVGVILFDRGMRSNRTTIW